MAALKSGKVKKQDTKSKRKGKVSKSQRVKDAESLIHLDRSVEGEHRQFRRQIDEPSPQSSKKPVSESDGWDLLRSMSELAKESVASKSHTTASARKRRTSQSNAVLTDLLTRIDGINVSQDNTRKTASPSSDRKPDTALEIDI